MGMHKCTLCGGIIIFGQNIVKKPKKDLLGEEITSHRFGFCENFCQPYEEINGQLAQSILVPKAT